MRAAVMLLGGFLFPGAAFGFKNSAVRSCALEYRSSQIQHSKLSAQIIGNPRIGYEYQEWYRQQSFRYVVAGYEIFRQMTYSGDVSACREMSATMLNSAERIVAVTHYISQVKMQPFELSFDDADRWFQRSRFKAE